MPIDSQSAFPVTSQGIPGQPELFTPLAQAPVDPNNPPWGILGAMGVWIISIALLILVPLFFLVPYSVHLGLSPIGPEYINRVAEIAATDKTAIFLQVVALFPIHILTFAMIWVLVTRFGRLPFFSTLGWGWHPKFTLWKSIALALLLFAAGTAIVKILGEDKPTQLEELINSSLAARYTIAVLAVLTAPLVEELMYRGVLYAALQRLIGVAGATFTVLGLFTLIHVPQYWPNFGVIGAVGLLSISLTLVRAYTGRLLPCVVIHLVFNSVTSIFLFVEPHLDRVPSAGDQLAALAFILSFIH